MLPTWWNMPPSYGSSPLSYKNKPSCTTCSQLLFNACLANTATVHLLRPRTSLEAVYWGRDLHSARQEIRESRKCHSQQDSQNGCSREQHRLGMVIIDLGDGVHGWS